MFSDRAPGSSIYRENYEGNHGAPAESIRPRVYFSPSSAPMPDISLYREQFPCKPLGPTDRPKPKTDYNPPCSPFQDSSTYRIDYIGCHGKPSTSIEPRSSWITPVSRFDDRTTYQYDYTRYCAEKYSVIRATQAQQISAVSSPFRECSTYRVYLSIYIFKSP